MLFILDVQSEGTPSGTAVTAAAVPAGVLLSDHIYDFFGVFPVFSDLSCGHRTNPLPPDNFRYRVFSIYQLYLLYQVYLSGIMSQPASKEPETVTCSCCVLLVYHCAEICPKLHQLVQ